MTNAIGEQGEQRSCLLGVGRFCTTLPSLIASLTMHEDRTSLLRATTLLARLQAYARPFTMLAVILVTVIAASMHTKVRSFNSNNMGRPDILSSWTQSKEGLWSGSYEFVQITDPQLGMLHGDEDWEKEAALLRLAVQRVNARTDADGQMPKFLVVSGDLINRFPGMTSETRELRARQSVNVQAALSGIDPSIALVLQPGNHDLGQGPPMTKNLDEYRSAYGDDHFSFWVGGVLYLAVNSQHYALDDGLSGDRVALQATRGVHHSWMLAQLAGAAGVATHVVLLSHIPPFVGGERETWGWANWEPEARREVLAAAASAGVHLWLSGHFHGGTVAVSDAKIEVVVSAACGSNINWTCPAGKIAAMRRPDFDNCVGRPQLIANRKVSGLRIFRVTRHAIHHHWEPLGADPTH